MSANIPASTRSLTTVIVTNRNHGHYLQKCLSSLSDCNVSVIIRDGSSDDDSRDISRKFPFAEFVSAEDKGANHAFALGLARVSSPYVSFITSTDWIVEPSWFAQAEAKLDADPSLSMVVGGIVGVANDGSMPGYDWPHRPMTPCDFKAVFFDWIFHGDGFTPISIVLRTDVAHTCLEPLSDFDRADSVISEDFFWKLSRSFFQRRFIATYLGLTVAACRLHTDRISDQEYLPARRKVLQKAIRKERGKHILRLRSIEFRTPVGELAPDRRIAYLDFVRVALLSFASNFRTRLQKGRPRDKAALSVYGETPNFNR